MPRLPQSDDRRITKTGANSPLNTILKRVSLGCLTASALWIGQSKSSACDCDRRGAGSLMGGPGMSGPLMGNSMDGMVDQGPGDPGMMPGGPMGPQAVLGGAGNFAYSPPPGTLGQTYQRPTWPIPAKKPPRIGMVQVRVNGAHNVVVQDTNEFRMEDAIEGGRHPDDPSLWYFESKPLIPGSQHIYRVVAVREDGHTEERLVRFVMGRVVTLDF